MRSITTEIYEELNKNRKGIGVNRTDVLQNIIDIIFDMKLQEDHKFHVDFTKNHRENSEPLSEELFYSLRKKQILDAIKESYSNEGKL